MLTTPDIKTLERAHLRKDELEKRNKRTMMEDIELISINRYIDMCSVYQKEEMEAFENMTKEDAKLDESL